MTFNLVAGGSNCSDVAVGQCGHTTIIGNCNTVQGSASYSLTGGQCSDNFSQAGIAFGCGATASTGISNFSLGYGTTTPNNGTTANSNGQMAVGIWKYLEYNSMSFICRW